MENIIFIVDPLKQSDLPELELALERQHEIKRFAEGYAKSMGISVQSALIDVESALMSLERMGQQTGIVLQKLSDFAEEVAANNTTSRAHHTTKRHHQGKRGKRNHALDRVICKEGYC